MNGGYRQVPRAVVRSQNEHAILMALLVSFCLAIAIVAGAEMLTAGNAITGHIQHLSDQGYQLSH